MLRAILRMLRAILRMLRAILRTVTCSSRSCWSSRGADCSRREQELGRTAGLLSSVGSNIVWSAVGGAERPSAAADQAALSAAVSSPSQSLKISGRHSRTRALMNQLDTFVGYASRNDRRQHTSG
eukprot:784575-Prorocentrum_minimum.AAC.2